MKLVKDIDDIVDNLKTLETYLKSKNDAERTFAQELVRNGITILIYKVNGSNHYAPAHFCAYLNNSMKQHAEMEDIDHKEADAALDKLLKGKAWFLQQKENEFLNYCKSLGLKVPKNDRIYWRVGTTSDPYMDIED